MPDGSHVRLPEPRVSQLVPPAADRARHREGLLATFGERQVNVLDRPAQREVGRFVTGVHFGQLGQGHRRLQRAAPQSFALRLVIRAKPVGQGQRFGHAFHEEGQPGVQHQFQPAAGPGLPEPAGPGDGLEYRTSGRASATICASRSVACTPMVAIWAPDRALLEHVEHVLVNGD